MRKDESLENEQYANLRKLLQGHRRQTKFDVIDSHPYIRLRKDLSSCCPRSDLVDEQLRTLWVLFEETYFQPIDELALRCLDYVDSTFNELRLEENHDRQRNSFIGDLQMIFHEEYITRESTGTKKGKNSQSWINEMFLVWQSCSYQGSHMLNNSKQSRKRLQQSQMSLKDSMSQQKLQQKMKTQQNLSQISILLYLAQSQWQTIVDNQTEHLNRIKEGVISEKFRPGLSIDLIQDKFIMKEPKLSSTVDRINFINCQIRYFRYQVPTMERKQLADSISKLIKIEGKDGEIKFVVTFQTGLSLGKATYSEEEFVQLNRLRDFSLLNFYFTGVKSKCNYNSQNFFGFQAIFEDNQEIKKIPRELFLERLKKETDFAYSSEGQSMFEDMEMCHQCKCLYQTKHLKKCGFSSPTEPKNISTTCHDPYLDSLIKNQSLSFDQKKALFQSNSRINEFFRYTYLNNTYSCHRYFCRLCMKNYSLSYPHLCPFCQGVCQCSRCLRSDTIFKMKSMYLQLGGDLKKLVHDRFYKELFFPSSGSPAAKLSIWKKGNHVPSEDISKMQLIIDQLQQIRLLSHQVKRREGLKLQLSTKRTRIEKERLVAHLNVFSAQLKVANL